MNAAPAFQLYVDDLLGGTTKFNNAEFGLYVRLLLAQYAEESLLDDDRELLSYGKGKTPLARIRLKFQKGPDGRLRNARMERTRQEQIEYRTNRSQSGKAGAEKRWHSDSAAIGSARPQPMANGMAKNSPPPPPPPSLKLKSDKGGDQAFKKLEVTERAIACGLELLLGPQWINDAGKWVNRIKNDPKKSRRVMAEVSNALTEHRVRTSPAQYAEQIWKEFK